MLFSKQNAECPAGGRPGISLIEFPPRRLLTRAVLFVLKAREVPRNQRPGVFTQCPRSGFALQQL
jgi:hypothetical protein